MADIYPFAGITALLEELAIRLSDIADSVGNMSPDAAGRIRVAAETVGNIATVTTVSNQTSIGGINATPQVPLLYLMSEETLRRNIVVS